MTWRSTSPSQLSTFNDCRRKWWRISVNGERQPPTVSAQRGSRVHNELENYLMHAKPCVDGTAVAMTRHLAPAGSVDPALVEVGFEFTPQGWAVPIRGRIDLIELENNRITDHKTTSNLKWSKSEEELQRDPQALIYSAVALLGGLDNIELHDPLKFRLVYGTTKSPIQTKTVETIIDKRQAVAGLEMFNDTVKNQMITSKADGWLDVEPNYQSCDKYGGCPFSEECRKQYAPTIKIVKELKPMKAEDKKNDFFASLSRRKAVSIKEEYKEQYDTVNPPDGLKDGEPLPVDEDKKQRSIKKNRIRYNDKSISALKKDEALEAIEHYLKDMSDDLKAIYAEHEPEGTKLSILKEKLELIDDILKGRIMKTDTKKEETTMQNNLFDLMKEAEQEKTVQETVQVQAPTQDTVQETVQEPIDEPVQVQETVQEPINEPLELPDCLKEQTPPHTPRMLLVDCHAEGAYEIEALIAPLIEGIEYELKKSVLTLDYGKGWQIVADEIRKLGWNRVIREKIVRIDSSSQLYRYAGGVLINLADIVIRSTR